MLKVVIPAIELFDNKTNEFSWSKQYELQLEHSLISLSKWESKWKKAFLTKNGKSAEELLDYVKCMTVTPNVDPEAYMLLRKDVIQQIFNYIEDPMTATTFYSPNSKPSTEIITSELIYYWMVMFQIPFECQKWHLNRLLTLINVCSIKNQPEKRMSRKQMIAERKALNDSRRARMHTHG